MLTRTAGVLLLVVSFSSIFVTGCSRPERVDAPLGTRVHLGDDWIKLRSAELQLTVEQERARDVAISEESPPESLDPSVLVEAAACYRALCISCHGVDGSPPEPMPDGGVPPRSWNSTGMHMGFFFGGNKMRRGLYHTIRSGGEPKDHAPSRMPAWGSSLSHEQIWGLVHYLESL